MQRILPFIFFLFCSWAAAQEPPTRMTPELLFEIKRVGEAALASDGRRAAVAIKSYSLKEDKGTTDLFLYDLRTGQRRPLLHDWVSLSNLQFAPSPYGERLFLVGKPPTAKDEAKAQVYRVNPIDAGVFQLTEFEDGCANLKVSPTGQHLAFTLDVKLDQEVSDLHKDLPKAEARIIDGLMFRHWNAWHDFKYSHLHIAPLTPYGQIGPPVDLMKDQKVDCPVPPFGGASDFDWSPDGKQLAYTAKDVPNWAESTNSDIYLVRLDQPEEAKNITEGMPGYERTPLFSPDGKSLAFQSMARAGFESDRNRIFLMDLAKLEKVEATAGLDRTVHGVRFSPDSRRLLFTSEHRGATQIFELDRQGGDLRQVSQGRFNWSLIEPLPDGRRALVAFQSIQRPTELALMQLSDGGTQPVTRVNDSLYEALELPTVEERWVKASDGKSIHCWVVYPPDFDPAQRYPMLTYCQGGPQGMIGQWFSYRWNFHLMAANGYIVLAPNRRGLPGFGREWNDSISRDWGGQAMQDILSATDELRAEPYVDPDRVAAIGASFGGYTVYWLMGNHQKRFATMVAHCGVFNLESMYGTTEELFFTNWELGGPYWEGYPDYKTFSPHQFVKNWDVPLLVIHGQKDFRVPVTQGIEAFTAAQVLDLPSRFLYFPEEGHWVLKPQNSVLWQRVFYGWLDQYCKKPE